MILHSSLYIASGSALIIWLSLHVISYRHRHHISIGDGDNANLRRAMSAQSNAIEYIPIGLLLLLSYELAGGNVWWLHLGGLVFLSGRLIHAYGFLNEKSDNDYSLRVLGMKISFYAMISLIGLNILRFLLAIVGVESIWI